MSGSWPESSGLRRPDGFEMIEISLGEMANGLSFGRKGVRDDACSEAAPL